MVSIIRGAGDFLMGLVIRAARDPLRDGLLQALCEGYVKVLIAGSITENKGAFKCPLPDYDG